MATLLAIIVDAVSQIGNIAIPTAVYSNTDETVVRMLALSNREGRDLARAANWTILQKLYTFPTVASTAEYALPSDFDRLLPDTEWNRSTYQPIMGPLGPEQWQVLKSGLIGSGVVGQRYRIYKSESTNSRTFRIDPTPSAVETLAFEYISTNWCASSGGTGQSAWAADTDVNILDRDLLTLGLIVRFKRAVGLEYASEADEYAQIFARTKAQDRPSPTISMIPRPGVRLLDVSNVPEMGFGV